MYYSLEASVLWLGAAFSFFSSTALSQGVLTKYTTITVSITDTTYITSTLSQSCGNTGGSSGGSPGGTLTGTEVGVGQATTWTAPDGETIVSSASVIVIGGSQTVTLPGVSSSTVLTTDGQTFTLLPLSMSSQPSGGTPQSRASSGSGSGSGSSSGQENTATLSVISTTGVIIVGTATITVPTGQTTPVTLTTDGFTFTFPPPPQSANPTATALTSPSTSGGVVFIGTDSFSIPTGLTTPVTTTRDGFTFTFSPIPLETVITTSNGFIIIGTDSFPVPSGTTTVTTDGVTLTFPLTQLPFPLSGQTTTTTSGQTTSTTVLPFFATWPSDASIIPVTTDVPQPQSTDGKSETPCKVWFFWVSVSPGP